MTSDLRRKVSSSAYASLASGLSALPRTPTVQRNTSYGFPNIYDSPGSQLRPDGDIFVFEIGSRYLRAGYAGESAPRGVLGFGPEQSRRVGDYRAWLPGFGSSRKIREIKDDFGTDYQLWSMDVRDVDFPLLENKLPRALWNMYTQYLLSDTFLPTRKFVLAIPPALPHPHLETLLTNLFRMFQPASVTLLPTPLLNTVAAGLRSSLVIDVGWTETIVTAVYEYSEVHQTRSVRAAKMLLQYLAKMLNLERIRQVGSHIEDLSKTKIRDEISFDECEDILVRLVWCYDRKEAEAARRGGDDRNEQDSSNRDRACSIPLASCNPHMTLRLPFSKLAEPADATFFAPKSAQQELDDHDQTLHMLAYRALLALSLDVRAVCISRIIVTGGGSNVPGLKRRILEELEYLIQTRGWDPVRSYGTGHGKRNLTAKQEIPSLTFPTGAYNSSANVSHADETRAASQESLPASSAQQEFDPIAEKIRQGAAKYSKPSLSGVLRIVETLGAYAGASLVAGLRIRGIVEIERDKFLQYGLAGASRDKVVASRSDLGPRPGPGERSSWTLGVFA